MPSTQRQQRRRHHSTTTTSFHMVPAAVELQRWTAHILMAALLLLAGVQSLDASTLQVDDFDMVMPNVTPTHAEAYLCTPVKVDYTKTYYIVGFEPLASMQTAHHILIYGCGRPGSAQPVWNCGEMSRDADDADDRMERGSPCARGVHTQIVFAWARDAKQLKLPDGVGYKVGKGSPIEYMVLQVHYAHMLPPGQADSSGIKIVYTQQVMPKQASILLLGTEGTIQPRSIEHLEVACTINEAKILHPFAYRTHTHSLGKVVSGYRVRRDANGVDQWTLLGKRDPMTPQMFYPVMNSEPLRQGDRLAARCTMESHRNRPTSIGATNEDEMCNFYLMYYVDENVEPLTSKSCFSLGAPFYYWRHPKNGLRNIPDLDASTL